MNILYIITGLGLGGAETQVCALADELAIRGHRVSIMVLTPGVSVRPANPSVSIFELGIQKSVLGSLRGIWLARGILRRFNFDVIHAHMFHANMFARLLKCVCGGFKLVCTAHSSNEGGFLRMMMYRLTNFISDCDTNVSQDAVDQFVLSGAYPVGRQKVIPNGVDVTKYTPERLSMNSVRELLGLSPHHFIFLSVGRLVDEKDYPNLLSALKIVSSNNSRVRLLLVGDGPLKADINALIREKGLGSLVTMLGARKDVPLLMSACDCFVMSSRIEGMPLVVLEAMASGKCVVSTDCGGVKDMLQANGFVVPIGDKVALAGAMIRCISMGADERMIFGKEARDSVVKRFSVDAIAQVWIRLYQQI